MRYFDTDSILIHKYTVTELILNATSVIDSSVQSKQQPTGIISGQDDLLNYVQLQKQLKRSPTNDLSSDKA